MSCHVTDLPKIVCPKQTPCRVIEVVILIYKKPCSTNKISPSNNLFFCFGLQTNCPESAAVSFETHTASRVALFLQNVQDKPSTKKLLVFVAEEELKGKHICSSGKIPKAFPRLIRGSMSVTLSLISILRSFSCRNIVVSQLLIIKLLLHDCRAGPHM